MTLDQTFPNLFNNFLNQYFWVGFVIIALPILIGVIKIFGGHGNEWDDDYTPKKSKVNKSSPSIVHKILIVLGLAKVKRKDE